MARSRPTGTNETAALTAIRDSLRDRGYPPSQREIAKACGWSSPSGANTLIKLMEARGLIEVSPGIPRGLKITDDGTEMITAVKMVEATEAV